MRNIEEYANPDLPTLLLGNKCDLKQKRVCAHLQSVQSDPHSCRYKLRHDSILVGIFCSYEADPFGRFQRAFIFLVSTMLSMMVNLWLFAPACEPQEVCTQLKPDEAKTCTIVCDGPEQDTVHAVLISSASESLPAIVPAASVHFPRTSLFTLLG